MSNRRNNALILKHHPLRFRFEDHFLGKHVLRSNFIPSSPHVGLWVGTTQCRSASDSLQKGAELFFPAPNRLFFFHLLFISPMNMLFRGVVPRYRQVLCANSFTSLAELSLHRAGKPALNYLVAEDRERVKGGEAACEALDVNSVFCYQPASSSCISMCFMLMYFFPPHWVPAT